MSTGGVITALNFVPGAAATMTSPTSVPLHLLALQQGAQPATLADLTVGGDNAGAATSDAQLRTAIVNVANYYLRLSQTRTPAQMETLIWDNTDGTAASNGADHGPSCAAFASLTLELAAQAVGQQSWVTGGTSYPWELPAWADVRVQTNPDSPGITSMVADATDHGRWHAVGDGYQPQPGDWAVFNGHVEVVTKYADGVLDTIGADSLPNLTVNAHSISGSLAGAGVLGFIDNGHLKAATTTGAAAGASGDSTANAKATPGKAATGNPGAGKAGTGTAAIPGLPNASALNGASGIPGTGTVKEPATAMSAVDAHAAVPGDITPLLAPTTGKAAATGTAQPAAKAGAGPAASGAATSGSASTGTAKTGTTSASSTAAAQQAFISKIAPGAVAAQQRYGVPAAVTIAQAIEESGWGDSELAAQYHNVFGIKGTGPAGSVTLPTSEYQGGHWVTVDAQFRVYHNDAESISDHAELLATSNYYTRAMADRTVPDAFAHDLTGVYATDPDYGANLIALMKHYNLYRFDSTATSVPSSTATASPSASATPSATGSPSASQSASPSASASPGASTGKASRPASGAGSGRAASTGGTRARIPGVATPTLAPSASTTAQASGAADTAASGNAQIPGLVAPGPLAPSTTASRTRPGTARLTSAVTPAAQSTASQSTASQSTGSRTTGSRSTGAVAGGSRVTRPQPALPRTSGAGNVNVGRTGTGSFGTRGTSTRGTGTTQARATAVRVPARATPGTGMPGAGARGAGAGNARVPASGGVLYRAELPAAVTTAFFASAKAPLARGEHLYRDVASCSGVAWELLAAIDWMECKADPRHSPVQGEKLGTVNPDGTSYATKSQALAQCAGDLIEVAAAVYGINLTARRRLSVRALAAAFAAFRWGSILNSHGVSAMEFPYSVAGLTAAHQKMHWPGIDEPDAPDRPGARFRAPFGAVPVALSLGYPATV